MSLASSPDCSRRLKDKALKLFFPAADQAAPNSFDEFFNRELYEESEDGGVKADDDGGTNLFTVNTCSSANGHETIYAKADQSERSPLQPWRKGLWCLSQRPGSQQLVVEKTRQPNRAPPSNISPSHLIANNNFAMRSPKSITQPSDTKSLSPTRLRQLHCWSPEGQQSLKREMTLSPSPTYSPLLVDGRIGYIDAWQQDFQNKTLELNDHYLENFGAANFRSVDHSSYSYAHPRRPSFTNDRMKMEQVRSATFHHPHRNTKQGNGLEDASNQDISAILTANMDATSRNMFSEPPDRNDMMYKFINEELPPLSDWTSQSPNSSNNSQNSYFSNVSVEHHQNCVYNTLPPSNWWSPPAAHPQHSAQASREAYPELVQPKPRRATHNVLYHEDHENGLGIQYPGSEEIGIAIPYPPAELQPSSIRQTLPKYCNVKPTHTNALTSHPALPPPMHGFSGGSPFTTPRRRTTKGLSKSPSPPISPTHRPSRSNRQRSPSLCDPSQHRRKSIHKSGPVRDSHAETSRHRSTSRPPRTPKTPKTTGEGCQLDFVNFTPKDAVKLLGDVAPSGSSKTRARREQEARERRKKLNEAALDAVRQAGGDVEALERAILS